MCDQSSLITARREIGTLRATIINSENLHSRALLRNRWLRSPCKPPSMRKLQELYEISEVLKKYFDCGSGSDIHKRRRFHLVRGATISSLVVLVTGMSEIAMFPLEIMSFLSVQPGILPFSGHTLLSNAVHYEPLVNHAILSFAILIHRLVVLRRLQL